MIGHNGKYMIGVVNVADLTDEEVELYYKDRIRMIDKKHPDAIDLSNLKYEFYYRVRRKLEDQLLEEQKNAPLDPELPNEKEVRLPVPETVKDLNAPKSYKSFKGVRSWIANTATELISLFKQEIAYLTDKIKVLEAKENSKKKNSEERNIND